MPSVYDLKPKFQNLLRPICTRMATAGVTANQVTIGAVALSFIGGALIAAYPDRWWALAAMPILLLVRMALNAIDGMLAREFGMKSRLGAVLNELGDVISDVALYLPMALVPNVPMWGIVAFVLQAVIIEFAGVIAIQIGSPRGYAGPMGKSDRAFWMGTLATLLALDRISPAGTTIYLSVLTLLGVGTVIRRARIALNQVA
ncbi:CDP-alcohol phosphatidyltransferase family protein [Rubripirellula reticaptiva]|uniref:Inner membrane protein YnbA n=1 Tax=Rubripirellula reticaptiva TaxID=2528013 RepID=A0A5C6F843_9BACT|nr:CDP-alcohol phosphatidyltransferase family protein [Rubripirellula reticaptiva]TWU57558.1 Inner membrane protein YnbA [Rubripirellula reticaptiva]